MPAMRQITRSLLTSLQTLTILPVSVKPAGIGQAALFFPLVGAFVGWAGAGFYALFDQLFGRIIASGLTVFFWVLLTGAFHEDGLADTADGLFASSDPYRCLHIMKDSRIGTFGALTLLFSVGLRWQALAILGPKAVAALVAVHALSRAATVLLAYITPPAGSGLAFELSQQLNARVALGALLQALIFSGFVGFRTGAFLLALTMLCIGLLHLLFLNRLGGVSGDGLGAAEQVAEVVLFLGLVASMRWQSFI